MRSPRSAIAWLVDKEWRELVDSRAWWVLLITMGPLVGVAFISAVRTYGEASGLNGTAAGSGEAFSPLVGIWAPTFSACELAAAFLLPFVAIRLVSSDRQSGAIKIEAQGSTPPIAFVSVKALVLAAGWLIASAPVVIAVALWRWYGGSIYAPELATVFFGHLLNASLTIAIAMAAATLTEHPSTAAILTLSVTVGTWVVNFIADVEGGIWERVAAYTPTALVAQLQHGLVRLDGVLVALSVCASGLVLSALWTRPGTTVLRRRSDSAALVALTAVIVLACSAVRATWDTSENRANSFAEADEAALHRIAAPLTIVAHLAPEDPRRYDLEHRVLSRLRRVMPDVRVRYESATSIGLFEQTAAGYGEVWYEMNGKKLMSRLTTAEGVLETIYALAGVAQPVESDTTIFRGHPLAAAPVGAATVFYGIWPALVAAVALLISRRQV